MLKVDDIARIRLLHRDGMSIREISRRYHHCRKRVKKALLEPEPKPYTRIQEPHCPVLGPFKAIILGILADEEKQKVPRKQRHTARKIFERLQKEHAYPGSYEQVRRFVRYEKQEKLKATGTFIPLSHDAGQRLECDFGHVQVCFPDGPKKVPVLLVTWSFSYHRLAIGLPNERTESILEGMIQAFEFFGCVAKEIWWDNPKTVATTILKGRERVLHDRYKALASHYLFEPLFCMPRSGNEKSYVENSVYDLQRNFCTPIPQVQDLSDFNRFLRQCCLDHMNHTVTGKDQTIGERFKLDQERALPLPDHRFEACVYADAKVDKYQTARYKTNWYSVPLRWAFEKVTLKVFVNKILIVAKHQVIATHQRCHGKHQQVLTPIHYLAVLGYRPGSLDHSNVFKNWHLPSCFKDLRDHLEYTHGYHVGSRDYIRILQLLAKHPITRIAEAIEYYLIRGIIDADNIINRVQHRKVKCAVQTDPSVPLLHIPKPSLDVYDRLLESSQKGVVCHG